MTFALSGGWGADDLPLGSDPFDPFSSNAGYLGVALVDVATGQRVLTERKDSRSMAFTRYGWTQAELAPFVGGQFALELIDNFSGSWGYLALDSIEIPAETGFELTPIGTTDVGAEMAGVNASVFVRVPFDVDALLSVDQLWLLVAYDDGFTAYVDGVEVASINAPVSPAYDAAATAGRADGEELVYVPIDLSAHTALLTPGPHVLAIQAMNVDAVSDPPGSADFLLQPFLYAMEDYLGHANHYVHPRLLPYDAPNRWLKADTYVRWSRINKLLQRRCGQIGLDDLQAFTRDHVGYICHHPESGCSELDSEGTNAGLIMDLKSLKLWLALGNPCENEYVEYGFPQQCI